LLPTLCCAKDVAPGVTLSPTANDFGVTG